MASMPPPTKRHRLERGLALAVGARLPIRSAILHLVGAYEVAVGLSILVGFALLPVDADGVFHLLWPRPLLALLWLVCGAAALFGAWFRQPGLVRIGYGVVVVPLGITATSYGLAWAADVLTGYGFALGLATALQSAVLVAVLLRLSRHDCAGADRRG